LIRERVDRKVASLLGLARRARKVVSGVEAVESAVKKRGVRLILTAVDASERSVAAIRALAARAGITCQTHLAMEQLGTAVGGAPRSCVAVTDPQLAEAVKSVLAKIPTETTTKECSRVEAVDAVGQADSRKVWR
jgi:ribosomal protein L7Ae-like RNA K-turn-binding protein